MQLRDLIHVAENKYNRLLTILIIIYLFSPFLVDFPIGNLVVFIVFFSTILLVAYQIHPSPKTVRTYLSLLVFTVLLRGLSSLPLTSLNADRVLEIASSSILLAFLTLSIYLMLRELTIAEQVTADLIKGGICVYLLLGFLWANLYGIIYSFDVHSFTATSATVSRADLTHFSFTTLTTVGYGDIAPVSQIARVLANLEGIVGVLYPAVFIARLVGLNSK